MEPKIGPNPAADMPIATQHISERQHHAFGRKRDHEHADSVEGTTGRDGPCCTKAVCDIAYKR